MGEFSEEYNKELRKLTLRILGFSMLIGGFGKSWRRINHEKFFPEYQRRKIGCHWEFTNQSTKYYSPVNSLSYITHILDEIHTTVNNWLIIKHKKPSTQLSSWREAFHPKKVQVWGRIAEDDDDSLAIHWFHREYQQNKTIKQSDLTGKMGRIGRVWHRMYPRYRRSHEEMRRKGGEYVELLTIFPDASQQTQDFLNFLPTTDFTKLWGE